MTGATTPVPVTAPGDTRPMGDAAVRTTRRLRYPLAAGVALLLCACSGGNTAHDRDALPPLGAIPTVTSVDQVTRPIDRYVPTLAEEERLVRARDLVTARCMRQYGFTYTGDGLSGMEPDAAGYRRATPVYGYFGTDVPRSSGYDRVLHLVPPPPRSAEYVSALTGTDRDGRTVPALAGVPVPPGGCARVGSTAVGGDPPRPDDHALPLGGPHVPTTDPRLAAAYSRWSECMKGKGFSYADPMSAYLDPKWTAGAAGGSASHGQEEVDTAAADLACKESTGLMGVAVAVESAYDVRYVNANRPALADFRSGFDARLRTADAVVAAGGTG